MINNDNINNLELLYDNIPTPFAIKTMEEIDEQLGGIADKPHKHNYYSVIWSNKATGKHIIDFKEYEIKPNDIFFVSPHQVHQVITNKKPSGFVILFTSEFLQRNSISNDFISNLKLFKSSDETPPLTLSEEMSETLNLFTNKMMSAFISRKEMYLEVIGSYLKLFLIECNGHCSLKPSTNTQYFEVSKNIVKNFKEIVEINFNSWHQVQQYAEKLNVTPNYLNEVIKSNLNISAKDFIKNRQILEAKRMIVFTEKSIKEIGFELGFEDPSHFSKFFKTNVGKSLQDFKENIKS